ncbi:META domain-containing protein [Flavobacterium sp. J27]|uniref:META domain-containing protein n=1 Tax=Flavobacterium sp. J27 TaxID=2060419 RepID=UPI00102FB7D1|nr:META domain-containing protein [Flavobacterium sp. J27]
MKTKKNSLLILVITILVSCATKKETNGSMLYNTTWELEYLSGPRIAFDGLFPDKKPYIEFDKEKQEVRGNNSCNGYSAKYTLNDTTISFGEPGPTTMMYCGEGEKQFLNMMQKINQFQFDNEGKLNLMINDVAMMRFKKK